MRLRPFACTLLLCAAGAALASASKAEDLRLPADAGIIGVTKAPYFAKGDGATDDTAALQKALNEHTGNGTILYLPNGTYLISESLRLPLKNPKGDTNWGNTHLQGQSRAKTVIRLKDASFTDPARPQAMLTSGPHRSADWFHNSVRNLTFDAGRGNPGAIGLQFFSNNTGCVREVTIRSGDGQGVTGLDLAFNDMNGPLLVKDVSVRGFGTGIACGHSVNSQTFSRIRLEGQREAGFRNGGQFLAIEDLQSRNTVPALVHRGGLIALVGARLTGGRSTAAIENDADLYARNVRTGGYARAIRSKNGGAAGPTVGEFTSDPAVTLFPSPPRALMLPIRQTPEVPREDPKRWVSVTRFGIEPDEEKDAAPAIQAAVDSGAATIYFPKGTYRIGRPVVLRGRVRHLFGGESSLEPIPPLMERKEPMFRLEYGAEKTVLIERLRTNFEGGPFSFIEHASPRTLVLKDIAVNFQGADSYHNRPGAGPAFIENMVGGRFYFTGQNVWARQFNQETEGLHIANDGGRLWVLGLKTERGGTLVRTSGGGETEVLGGLCYTTTAGKLAPMFVNDESAVSVTLGERHFGNDPYVTVLSETRDGVTRQFLSSDPMYQRRMVLYSGHPKRRSQDRATGRRP